MKVAGGKTVLGRTHREKIAAAGRMNRGGQNGFDYAHAPLRGAFPTGSLTGGCDRGTVFPPANIISASGAASHAKK